MADHGRTCNFLKIREHAASKPRFVDKTGLPGAIESPLTGEEVGFEVKVDSEHLRVGYYTPGCGYYHAAASAVAALADGQTISAARDLSIQRLYEYFDGYPEDKHHYLSLSLCAFQNALFQKGLRQDQEPQPAFDGTMLRPQLELDSVAVDPFRLVVDSVVNPEVADDYEIVRDLFRTGDHTALRAMCHQWRASILQSTEGTYFARAKLLLELDPLDSVLADWVIRTYRRTFYDGQHFSILGVALRAGAAFVPAGSFERGSISGHRDERPVTRLWLQSFWIDLNPLDEGSYSTSLGAECVPTELPATRINWLNASKVAFSLLGRLPTEEEWEKAARGGAFLDGDQNAMVTNPNPSRIFPWGDSRPDHLVAYPPNSPSGPCRSSSNPAHRSPYGLYNMAGNVWEWCSDLYNEKKYSNLPNEKNTTAYVIRGGAWDDIGTNDVSCSGRYYDDWFASEHVNGLRLVYSEPIVAIQLNERQSPSSGADPTPGDADVPPEDLGSLELE